MVSSEDIQHDLTPAVQDAVARSRKLFVAAASELRPRLHRFCSRMVGSSLDGEDVVQETLADAFYNLASLKDPSRFESWLFRIGYHKCIDFLRREKHRDDDVSFEDEHDRAPADDGALDDAPIDEALATLIGELPPKERAAVLLKDVLDYPLTEVAEIADSTLGGVKAALHRGRAKLRGVKAAPAVAALDVDDGGPAIIHWRRFDGQWRPHTATRVWWNGAAVVRIRDYVHVDYLLREARIEPVV